MGNLFRPEFFEYEGILRLLIAALLGGIMGLERTRKRREAGFRTYMLVAIGSAMAVLVGIIMGDTSKADTTRIAAAALTGVGFIGAGSIIISRANRVTGLTTAAGLWVSVTVGLAVGCGYYTGAVALVAISMLVTVLGEKAQEQFQARGKSIRLSILFGGGEYVLPFIAEIQALGYKISGLDMSDIIGKCVSATLLLQVPQYTNHKLIVEGLRKMPGVVYIDCE